MLNHEEIQKLIKAAAEARNNAYAPYSKYEVGAAVMFAGGKVFAGCNVENASFGLTNCAERTAIFKGISEGEREIVAVAISVESIKAAAPCGACRQVIREFGPSAQVFSASESGEYSVKTLEELLPDSFGPENLGRSDKK